MSLHPDTTPEDEATDVVVQRPTQQMELRNAGVMLWIPSSRPRTRGNREGYDWVYANSKIRAVS